MLVTPNMGLTEWDNFNDIFSYTALAANFVAIDQHDHTASKGVQIPTGGIANLAVTAAKIANTTITNTQLAVGAAIANIAAGSITSSQIGTGAITGSTDGGTIKTDYTPAFSTYKEVTSRYSTVLDSSVATSTYILFNGGALINTPVGSATAVAHTGAIYLDPADYSATTGSTTRTTKLSLRAHCFTNAVAPATTFTVGLYPITAFAGASGAVSSINTVGTVVGSSTVTFTTPGASNSFTATSSDFTAPTAGFYCLAFTNAAIVAASSKNSIVAWLRMRQT